MLSQIIRHTVLDFGLKEIKNNEMLDAIRQTAFSWTSLPGSICLAMNRKYYHQASNNPNIVAIVAPPIAISDEGKSKGLVLCVKADEFFYHLHNMAIHKMAGVSEYNISRQIADSATIAKTAIIGQHVVIGKNAIIDHGCIIMDNTIIGDSTVIGPKSIIGVDGFFEKRIKGRKEHLQHFGGVRIGDNCRIFSDVTIARSVNYLEYTEINDTVHIGHKSLIGHDCKIGQGSDISVKAVIAGRVHIGKRCWIGANTCISNACKVGDDASVRIGAVVIRDVSSNTEVSGNFAIEHRKNLNRFAKERLR